MLSRVSAGGLVRTLYLKQENWSPHPHPLPHPHPPWRAVFMLRGVIS